MVRDDYGSYLINDRHEQRSLALALWLAIVHTLQIWWATQKLSASVKKERKALAMLPDHLLSDIGISRGDALTESNRRANDLPTARLT